MTRKKPSLRNHVWEILVQYQFLSQISSKQISPNLFQSIGIKAEIPTPTKSQIRLKQILSFEGKK